MLHIADRVVIDLQGFEALLAVLVDDGFEIVGPTMRRNALALGRITSVEDLPRGIGDGQEPGRYRLHERLDDALFGFAATPQTYKAELYPPRVELVQIRRTKHGTVVHSPPRADRRLALLGVRSCDLAAIVIQDRVLIGGAHHDADYEARRAQTFIVAISCSTPSGTCFCASMGTGPSPSSGFDLAATELLSPEHRFLVEMGTARGCGVIEQVPHQLATEADFRAAHRVTEEATERMGRVLPTDGLRDALMANLEHPRWTEVADRCLGCANCTLACPTCFCTTVEDTGDMTGQTATRTRQWDSCFTVAFAELSGGSARPSLRARYRQWLTHKLATWHDQFGSSGCVGCGRCITWCPVGIDITEEATVIAARQSTPSTGE
jgi:sulfhydrogenase subunit beta (sulfur reductase)